MEGTKAEATLWKFILKSKQMGYQFNRQYALDKYIVDFICRKLKLVIEIDGSSHNHIDNCNNDYERQKYIESLGYQFIRYSEFEVLKHLESVITKIEFAIYALEEELNLKSD